MITKIGYELIGKGFLFPEMRPYESQNVSDEGLSTFGLLQAMLGFAKLFGFPG